MTEPLSPSVQRVQQTLKHLGFSHQLRTFPSTTRSARDAARAIGCRVEQIAKSLVFRGKRTHRPVLVIASGGNRVDEEKLGEEVAEPVEKADAEFVRQHTGFAIGGVPPIGHREQLETFIDKDLLRYEEIWAAAGSPYAVFRLTPTDLVKMTKGRVVEIAANS
ncbi:MAG: YbaK/EbsC family protein [Nitrospinota bacterium]|nr:MAG: YbaK/EbsC family protein [Nitrospinota bacterium]